MGSLPGLDYDAVNDVWYALSDGGSDLNRTRLYTLRIRVSPTGIAPLELLVVVTMLPPDGTEHRMLVLERTYMSGIGNSLRVHQIDTRQGSDILAGANLMETSFGGSCVLAQRRSS